MGCNCGGSKTIHQVVNADGSTTRYLSEAEARAAANATGGTYQSVQR